MTEVVVGALIGGVLALAGGVLGVYLTARYTRETERARLAREADREARAAEGVRRLLVDELNALALHLGYIAGQERGPGAVVMATSPFLPTREWGQQKPALAASLRKDVWDGLPPLYHNVEQLRARFVARPNDPLTDADRTRFAGMAEQAAVAANLLDAVGDEHRVVVITDDRGRPLASSRDASL